MRDAARLIDENPDRQRLSAAELFGVNEFTSVPFGKRRGGIPDSYFDRQLAHIAFQTK